MMPAFVAMNRMVAARMPTYTSIGCWKMPRSNCLTTPSTGSPAKPPWLSGSPSSVEYEPSACWVTGSADSAMDGSTA